MTFDCSKVYSNMTKQKQIFAGHLKKAFSWSALTVSRGRHIKPCQSFDFSGSSNIKELLSVITLY